MPNGRLHDNPLTDLVVYGLHPFPEDIELLLLHLDELGRDFGYRPLGEHCPFQGREFRWAEGLELEDARREVEYVLAMLETGRAREVLHDPLTGQPFETPSDVA